MNKLFAKPAVGIICQSFYICLKEFFSKFWLIRPSSGTAFASTYTLICSSFAFGGICFLFNCAICTLVALAEEPRPDDLRRGHRDVLQCFFLRGL